MSTFTEEIKNEIIRSPIKGEGAVSAFLSAYVRTCGSIISDNGRYGFQIVTENERTAEFISSLIETEFGATLNVTGAKIDAKSGKDKLTFDLINENSVTVLEKLGLIKIHGDEISLLFGLDDTFFKNEDTMVSYVKGAFLGGGSCTLPEEQTYSRTGYHFEIIFSNRITANDFCEILCNFEILAKMVTRKDSAVVYIKSKEVISDLLNAMQTFKCLDKLCRISEHKDRSNNENRVSNCSVSNIDKALTASVAQIKAIEVISQTVGLKFLKDNLFEVAEARLADKNASMQELADRLNITKSCINHRMKKIMDMAAQLT